MKVIMCALSAKYVHRTLAPWCLKAYCDQFGRWDVRILEASINDELSRIAREIYLQEPQVLGLSCYIWNIHEVRRLCLMVKRLLPGCIIVLGGPEVSHGGEYPFADYIIQGPGEGALAGLLVRLSSGDRPKEQILLPGEDPFPNLPSPYTPQYFAAGGEGGSENRLTYYESSRGCPYACTYCLSSETEKTRYKPLDAVFEELALLMRHGAGTIKFVDRTFNANPARAKEILRWVGGLETGCTFHFEVAPDLFDREMLALLAGLPKGRVQLELGIQSIHIPTLEAIRRLTHTEECLDNIRRLAKPGNCHIHVDLIAGLPHETMETFARGFDACIRARPHMLQLGFLKVLRGTEMRRMAGQWGIVFHEEAPYEVVRTDTMSTRDLLLLKEIEEVTDKYYNSGKYLSSLDYALTLFPTPFACFQALADFCRGSNLRISLKRSYALLLDFLKVYGDADAAGHWIRLDGLTYDPKGQLPDALTPQRDKEAERACRRSGRRHCRAERFPGGAVRVFDYDRIDPVTGACHVDTLP